MQISHTLHFPGVDLHHRHIDDCIATNNSLCPIFRYTINSRSITLHLHASLILFIPCNEIVLLFINPIFARSCRTYISPISYFLLHVSAARRHQHRVHTHTHTTHTHTHTHAHTHAIPYIHISSKRFPQQCSQDVKKVTRCTFSSRVMCLMYSSRFRSAIQTSSNFLDP